MLGKPDNRRPNALSAEQTITAHPIRILVLGGTGTIGRAAVRELVRRGYEVACVVRPGAKNADVASLDIAEALSGAEIRSGDVTDASSFALDGFRGERFDAVMSCLASRTGTPSDARAVDYEAHAVALDAAIAAGVPHFVLLSAICVQKPMLAFQHAKLAFERLLMSSGIDYTIVRPTAFFKSLSGQIDRVKRGKPFLVFGDGALTACKPISDHDLAVYLADCLDDPGRRNRILPIGGPGDAITPREQGERLFALIGCPPRFRRVPIAMLDLIIAVLDALGRAIPAVREKAEFARIGRYYATESMLVRDPVTGRYDAAATPSTGSETLFDHYERIVLGEAASRRR